MRFKTILEHLLKDRSFLDYWSLIHLIFGMLIAFVLKINSFSITSSIIIALLLMILWEFVEPKIFKYVLKKEFRENTINQVMDLIYGLIGFLVYWLFGFSWFF
jgi:membrane protein YdbS with pleckstrin-like domain